MSPSPWGWMRHPIFGPVCSPFHSANFEHLVVLAVCLRCAYRAPREASESHVFPLAPIATICSRSRLSAGDQHFIPCVVSIRVAHPAVSPDVLACHPKAMQRYASGFYGAKIWTTRNLVPRRPVIPF